jgi:hypothetical protein
MEPVISEGRDVREICPRLLELAQAMTFARAQVPRSPRRMRTLLKPLSSSCSSNRAGDAYEYRLTATAIRRPGLSVLPSSCFLTSRNAVG